MKLTKYLVLGAAMLSMVACNKKDDVKEFDATVSVKIASSELRLDEAASAKVSKLTVLIYTGDTQEAIKTVDGALEVKGIQCKAGDKKLVVLANYATPDNLIGLTLPQLKALTEELTTQPTDNLVMTSKVTPVSLQVGENKYGYPGGNLSTDALAITRVHARAEVIAVQQQMSPVFQNKYSVKFKRVAALIAKKKANLFDDENADAAYLFGIRVKGGGYTPADYTENAELVVNYDEATLPQGFYLLENKSDAHPTILVLEGTLCKSNGDELSPEEKQDAFAAGWIVGADDATTYYPIRINWTDPRYTYDGSYNPTNKIERNHYYKISLKVTGPGTNDPESPEKLATLDVKCEVAAWVPVAQNVEW